MSQLSPSLPPLLLLVSDSRHKQPRSLPPSFPSSPTLSQSSLLHPHPPCPLVAPACDVQEWGRSTATELGLSLHFPFQGEAREEGGGLISDNGRY